MRSPVDFADPRAVRRLARIIAFAIIGGALTFAVVVNMLPPEPAVEDPKEHASAHAFRRRRGHVRLRRDGHRDADARLSGQPRGTDPQDVQGSHRSARPVRGRDAPRTRARPDHPLVGRRSFPPRSGSPASRRARSGEKCGSAASWTEAAERRASPADMLATTETPHEGARDSPVVRRGRTRSSRKKSKPASAPRDAPDRDDGARPQGRTHGSGRLGRDERRRARSRSRPGSARRDGATPSSRASRSTSTASRARTDAGRDGAEVARERRPGEAADADLGNGTEQGPEGPRHRSSSSTRTARSRFTGCARSRPRKTR